VIHQVNVLVEKVTAWNTIDGFAFVVLPHVGVINDNDDTVATEFLQFGHYKHLAARVKWRHRFINEQDTWAFVVQKDLPKNKKN
jgi:hypothetical protein